MGTPHVTEDTRSEICRILAWDLKQLESGTYAFVDHSGRFHPLGSARERLAGQPLSAKAATGHHQKTDIFFGRLV